MDLSRRQESPNIHELEPPRNQYQQHKSDEEREPVDSFKPSAHSTNKILTNLINNFLGDYYGAHNKSIEYTRKVGWKNSLDKEYSTFQDITKK